MEAEEEGSAGIDLNEDANHMMHAAARQDLAEQLVLVEMAVVNDIPWPKHRFVAEQRGTQPRKWIEPGVMALEMIHVRGWNTITGAAQEDDIRCVGVVHMSECRAMRRDLVREGRKDVIAELGETLRPANSLDDAYQSTILGARTGVPDMLQRLGRARRC